MKRTNHETWLSSGKYERSRHGTVILCVRLCLFSEVPSALLNYLNVTTKWMSTLSYRVAERVAFYSSLSDGVVSTYNSFRNTSILYEQQKRNKPDVITNGLVSGN